jgi:hypothetical protein
MGGLVGSRSFIVGVREMVIVGEGREGGLRWS